MSDLIETGTLPIGIDIDGCRCRSFRLRPGTLRDSLKASESLISSGIDPAGADANTLRYATIAQRLEIDGVEPEKITLDFMLDMHDRDVIVIEEAYDAVEKKLDLLSASSPTPG